MAATEDRATHEQRGLRESALYDRATIAEIQRAAREGLYDIRGFGAKRRLPHFDDLLVLGASISRYPLEGYRERCDTSVTLGTRFAKRPLDEIGASVMQQVERDEDHRHFVEERGRRPDTPEARLERGEVEDRSGAPRHSADA